MANPSTPKADLVAQAEVLGLDPAELGADGKEATNQQLADAINAKEDAIREAAEASKQELSIDADTLVAMDPSVAVPFAGLLVADPSLKTAELTRTEWDEHLQKYLDSPRP